MINIVGCGWLGKALGKHLNKKGYDVCGSTTSETNVPLLESLGITPYVWRLGNQQKDLPLRIPAAKVAVILLSPKVITPHLEELTQQLFSAGTRHLIIASTSGVYPNSNAWVKENDAVHTASPHSGIDVLAMENKFREDERFETMILRFSGLYGPDRDPGNFLRSTNPYSGGDNPINLVHQEDCIRALSLVLVDFKNGKRFNICADEHPTRKTFYTHAAKAIGNEPPVFGEPASTPHKFVSNELYKEEYGFQYIHSDPMKDINQGL